MASIHDLTNKQRAAQATTRQQIGWCHERYLVRSLHISPLHLGALYLAIKLLCNVAPVDKLSG